MNRSGAAKQAARVRKIINHLNYIKMRTKTMLQLAKSLDFTNVYEMMEYFVGCHINGNFSQCSRLFSELTKQGKKDLIAYLLSEHQTEQYDFYFKLL